MIYGYIRVSTEDQENGPQVQRNRIGAACTVDAWFEDHVSGKNMKRPALQDLLSRIKRGDTLMVTKVDRLSRSVLDFATLMADAAKDGWSINVLELGIDMASPMGSAMVQMMAIFAELERKLISQRVKDAMAIVKANGPGPGKKEIGAPRQYADDVVARIRELRDRGLSLRAISAEVGVHFTHVGRLLAR